ncbi:unnamed protein product [Nesidiocoris tenuis]|uniref:Uncharacterized protein n=1 Tax=Nesidiocoris tenuis TaxID=355587 RepID=A0A6H5HCV9_9HEMI|nr:unnamed protein product [Nesidiocoris tenuis]
MIDRARQTRISASCEPTRLVRQDSRQTAAAHVPSSGKVSKANANQPSGTDFMHGLRARWNFHGYHGAPARAVRPVGIISETPSRAHPASLNL